MKQYRSHEIEGDRNDENDGPGALDHSNANGVAFKLVAGAALALVTWALVASFPDIKRYIRMSMM
jgi:hypothetical protein